MWSYIKFAITCRLQSAERLHRACIWRSLQFVGERTGHVGLFRADEPYSETLLCHITVAYDRVDIFHVKEHEYCCINSIYNFKKNFNYVFDHNNFLYLFYVTICRSKVSYVIGNYLKYPYYGQTKALS